MVEVLSQRRLNRITLARQYLLERSSVSPLGAIQALAGMQSQAPLAPYVGLWSRLVGFSTSQLTTLVEARQVVRLHLMRNTVHLAGSRDALEWRPLFSAQHAAQFRAHFPGTDGVELSDLVAEASELLDARPRTRAELGRLLSHRWPQSEPAALAYAATHHLALCQVPPRGTWGKGGPAAWARLETWLGQPLGSAPARELVEELVLRYLGAFGPAQVADVQAWSGLTRLEEVVQRLPLATFHGEDGQTLYDLPDAQRPAEDQPAPPRFLPEYDNLLLSYRDRRRINPQGRPVPLPPGDGARTGTFLIDGSWHGTWQIQADGLHLHPFAPLPNRDLNELLTEARGLASLLGLSPDHDVRVNAG